MVSTQGSVSANESFSPTKTTNLRLGDRWGGEVDDELLGLFDAGDSLAEIANLFGVSAETIATRLLWLGRVPKRAVAHRA